VFQSISWCSDNGSIVGIIQEGDCSKISIDQLRALEKLLPDSGTIEMVKGYKGDLALLGTAEDFFLKLIKVKQLSLRCWCIVVAELLWLCCGI